MTDYTRNPMSAPVQNPHIMYRSEPLSVSSIATLKRLGYSSHSIELFLKGLPVIGIDNGEQTVEYPDGRRIVVQSKKSYNDQGKFERYEYQIVRELDPAPR